LGASAAAQELDNHLVRGRSSMSAMAMPIDEAAAVLGISTKKLRGLIHHGAPAASRGRRGPGGKAAVDPVAVAEWLRQRVDAAETLANLRALVDDLPSIIANVLFDLYRAQSGPHKNILGANSVLTWYMLTNAIRDRRGMPELEPEQIPLEVLLMRTGAEMFPRKGNI
jgi:hypothetical protein